MVEERKGITEEVTTDGKHLKLVSITWENAEGKEREWEATRRVMPNGELNTGTFDHIVVIVPITNDNKFVFISQFRATVGSVQLKHDGIIDESKSQVIEFPAGIVEKYNNILETAFSELQEEAGYSANVMLVLNEGPISAGMSFEYMTVYVAAELESVPKKDGEEERGITTYEIPILQAETWLENRRYEGFIIDAKVKPLVVLAIEYMKKNFRR